jgi:hypothetical protein
MLGDLLINSPGDNAKKCLKKNWAGILLNSWIRAWNLIHNEKPIVLFE